MISSYVPKISYHERRRCPLKFAIFLLSAIWLSPKIIWNVPYVPLNKSQWGLVSPKIKFQGKNPDYSLWKCKNFPGSLMIVRYKEGDRSLVPLPAPGLLDPKPFRPRTPRSKSFFSWDEELGAEIVLGRVDPEPSPLFCSCTTQIVGSNDVRVRNAHISPG